MLIYKTFCRKIGHNVLAAQSWCTDMSNVHTDKIYYCPHKFLWKLETSPKEVLIKKGQKRTIYWFKKEIKKVEGKSTTKRTKEPKRYWFKKNKKEENRRKGEAPLQPLASQWACVGARISLGSECYYYNTM